MYIFAYNELTNILLADNCLPKQNDDWAEEYLVWKKVTIPKPEAIYLLHLYFNTWVIHETRNTTVEENARNN